MKHCAGAVGLEALEAGAILATLERTAMARSSDACLAFSTPTPTCSRRPGQGRDRDGAASTGAAGAAASRTPGCRAGVGPVPPDPDGGGAGPRRGAGRGDASLGEGRPAPPRRSSAVFLASSARPRGECLARAATFTAGRLASSARPGAGHRLAAPGAVPKGVRGELSPFGQRGLAVGIVLPLPAQAAPHVCDGSQLRAEQSGSLARFHAYGTWDIDDPISRGGPGAARF